MHYGRDTKTAFTLVELLVVIAIISLLAGLLLPALEKAVRQAHKASCASRHKQLSLAITLYGDEFRGFPPYFVKDLKWGPYYAISTIGYLDVPGTVRVPTGLGLLPYCDYLPYAPGGVVKNNGVNTHVGAAMFCPTLQSDAYTVPENLRAVAPYSYQAVSKNGNTLNVLQDPIPLRDYPYDKSGKGRSAYTVFAACPQGNKYGTIDINSHDREGCNVLFFDGTVRFWPAPPGPFSQATNPPYYNTVGPQLKGFSILYTTGNAGPYPGWGHLFHQGEAVYPSDCNETY